MSEHRHVWKLSGEEFCELSIGIFAYCSVEGCDVELTTSQAEAMLNEYESMREMVILGPSRAEAENVALRREVAELREHDEKDSIEVLRLIVEDLRSPTIQYAGILRARANWLAVFTNRLDALLEADDE